MREVETPEAYSARVEKELEREGVVVVVPLSRGGTLCVNNIQTWREIGSQWGIPEEAYIVPIPGRPAANYGYTLLNGIDRENQQRMFRVFLGFLRRAWPQDGEPDMFTLLATPADAFSTSWEDFRNFMGELGRILGKGIKTEEICRSIAGPSWLSLADAFALWDQAVMNRFFPECRFIIEMPSLAARVMEPDWRSARVGVDLLYRVVPEAFINEARKRGGALPSLLQNKRWRNLGESLGVEFDEGNKGELIRQNMLALSLPEEKEKIVSPLISLATPSRLLRKICDEYLCTVNSPHRIPVYSGSCVLSFLYRRARELDATLIQQPRLRRNTLYSVDPSLMIGIRTIVAPPEDENVRDHSIFLEI